ncbi:MAG: permease [Clostridia bacterium]|nr:permease [Clostridia bacterium]
MFFFYSFALGADIAFLRLFVTVFAGYIGGAMMKMLSKKSDAFKAYYTDENAKQTDIKKYKLALKTMLKTTQKTFPYLIIGMALTALFEKFIPKDVFADIFANNAGLGVLFGSVLGVPLYFCGGGSIPLILSWMNNGMSMGSVMAFVIAGPATKINNITAIAAMIKKKYLLYYFLFIAFFSIMAGLITDLFF